MRYHLPATLALAITCGTITLAAAAIPVQSPLVLPAHHTALMEAQKPATKFVKKHTLADGLKIEDVKLGKGPTAKSGDTVAVHYTGWLANGTIFDASSLHGNQQFTFQLGAGQVIKGWDIGVVGMRVGGVRQLVIPAKLAYGSQGAPPTIPANSTLTFRIHLLAVQPAGAGG